MEESSLSQFRQKRRIYDKVIEVSHGFGGDLKIALVLLRAFLSRGGAWFPSSGAWAGLLTHSQQMDYKGVMCDP